MPVRFQLVIDCKDPELLARFWAAALGYVLEPPPRGIRYLGRLAAPHRAARQRAGNRRGQHHRPKR